MTMLQLIYGKSAEDQKWFVDGRGRKWYQKGQIMDLTVFLEGGADDPEKFRLGLYFHTKANSRGSREVLGTDVQLVDGWCVRGRMATCRLRIMGSAVNSKHNRKVATCLAWTDGEKYAVSDPFYITSNRTSYSRAQTSETPGAKRKLASSTPPPASKAARTTAESRPPPTSTVQNATSLRHETCMLNLALDCRRGQRTPAVRSFVDGLTGATKPTTSVDTLLRNLTALEHGSSAVKAARRFVAGFCEADNAS